MLDVVNENDIIIGSDTRDNIHKNGLIHREIGVWVFNDRGEVALQKRTITKKAHPGCWQDSTSGHVESGDDYLESAVRELEEETGIIAKQEDLIPIEKFFIGRELEKDGNNNHFEFIYAYKFKDGIDNLRVEEREAEEIKWWNIDDILNANEELKKQFVPYLFSEIILNTLRKVKELIK